MNFRCCGSSRSTGMPPSLVLRTSASSSSPSPNCVSANELQSVDAATRRKLAVVEREMALANSSARSRLSLVNYGTAIDDLSKSHEMRRYLECDPRYYDAYRHPTNPDWITPAAPLRTWLLNPDDGSQEAAVPPPSPYSNTDTYSDNDLGNEHWLEKAERYRQQYQRDLVGGDCDWRLSQIESIKHERVMKLISSSNSTKSNNSNNSNTHRTTGSNSDPSEV